MATTLTKKALLLAALASLGVSTTQAQLVVKVDAGGTLDEADAATHDFFFTVNAASGSITDLDLFLDFTFTDNGGDGGAFELSATLIAPDGTTTSSVFDAGRILSSSIAFDDVRFTDGGNGDFIDFADGNGLADEGPYDPDGAFSVFNGMTAAAASGTWTLRMTSTSVDGDTGTLFRQEGSGTELSMAGLTAVPEPSTYALVFGLGALGFAAIRRRMNKA